MKRFLGALLAMMLFAFPVMAESLDLSNMSTDELITLSNQVTSELKARFSSDADTIAEGMYVVGRDIKSGSYEFTCTLIRTISSDYSDASIYVFPDETSLGDMDKLVQGAKYLVANDTVGLNLVDGMVLYLSGCSGQLVAVERSWAVN